MASFFLQLGHYPSGYFGFFVEMAFDMCCVCGHRSASDAGVDCFDFPWRNGFVVFEFANEAVDAVADIVDVLNPAVTYGVGHIFVFSGENCQRTFSVDSTDGTSDVRAAKLKSCYICELHGFMVVFSLDCQK